MTWKRISRGRAAFCLVTLSAWWSAVPAGAADDLVPGAIRADATFEHIGVVWTIDGDDNLDSAMVLDFRRQGDVTWHAGAPAMRAHPSLIVDGAALGFNTWAASAMFLEPGMAYELRLTLTDPDGGGSVETIVASTRTPPPATYGGTERWVAPGAGGGDGTPGNPYLGLQTAADNALPGDHFRVTPGYYAPFQLLVSGTPSQPIVFSGPADGSAVVDGTGTDRGVVTLGEYDQTISNVVLEGLTIEDGHWGVDAQHSSEIVIRHNHIREVDFGVYNRRGDGLEGYQTVCDNVLEGRVPWPGVGIPSERGIDLRGFGNVVCHNTVRNFGDCVSVQPFTGESFGNDVFGNDASYCVDDGIEIDYNRANVRVWRNRVMNARTGVSIQPVRGGPAYIFRNEFFNLESAPIKMNNGPAGFIVAHNTSAQHGNGHSDSSPPWRNAIFRNNLFLGTRYAFEFVTVATDGFRDFDFDGWGTTREIGGASAPFFKWDDVRYDRLPDLQAIGVEVHGVEARFDDLENPVLPPAFDQPAEPGSRDLRLVSGAPETNAGEPLSNLNDPFLVNGLPDMGAFELGQPLPHYGPRIGIFSDGFESGNVGAWSAAAP
jgi:hypothetical protein